MKPLFHFRGSPAFCQPQTVADAEHVRIHGDGVAAERHGVYHVGSLFAHARKTHQILDNIGHLAPEML